MGCVTPCWVKQEHDLYNVLVLPIDYQAVLGMEECYPQGAWSQLSLAQFYLGRLRTGLARSV